MKLKLKAHRNDKQVIEKTYVEAVNGVYSVLNRFYIVPEVSLVDITRKVVNSLGFEEGGLGD